MSRNLALDLSQFRREMARQSLYSFAKLYLPRHVSVPPSVAHEEIYSVLEEMLSNRGQYLAVAAPRGFGKTTMITMVYVLYSICYRTESFIVILSDSSALAVRILDEVRKELEHNSQLLTDFPELTGPKPIPWKRDEIVTPNGVKLLALGSKQSIRGLKHRASRPTLVIADDIEKAENTFSEDSRNKLRSWLNRSVFKIGTRQTNYCFLGTLYHPFCLLAEYVSDQEHPHWVKKLYKAVVSWATQHELWEQWAKVYWGRELHEGSSGPAAAKRFYEANRIALDAGTQVLWPQRWTYYELMEEYQRDPLSFNSELQNEPVNERDCFFNVEEFAYWDDTHRSVDELVVWLGANAEYYGACDPSLGKDFVRGDRSAIIVLARDKRDGSLYILFADLARHPPTQTIADIFAYYRRFPFVKFAVETNQFQELLAQDIERIGREQSLYLPLEHLTNTTDKIRRVQGLHPWIKNGTIKFSRSHRLLLEEARFFPRGKHDDGLDALEMAVRMAEQPQVVPSLYVMTFRDDRGDEDDDNW